MLHVLQLYKYLLKLSYAPSTMLGKRDVKIHMPFFPFLCQVTQEVEDFSQNLLLSSLWDRGEAPGGKHL